MSKLNEKFNNKLIYIIVGLLVLGFILAQFTPLLITILLLLLLGGLGFKAYGWLKELDDKVNKE